MKKSILLLFSFLLLLGACNNDRVDPDFSYSSLNDFYKNNREQEQSITIRTDTGNVPILGKKGTELYGTRAILEYANGDSVGLPWTVKLIELYTIKDYLLYQLPTVGNAVALESGGIIKVNAYDSIGESLKVKDELFYEVKLSTSPTITGMGIYQGSSAEENFINWAEASDGSLIDINTKYDLQLASLGWQHVAKPFSESTTTLTFTIDGSGGENIDLWVIPTDKHALFYGNNLKVEAIPINSKVRILAMALNQDNDFVLFDKTVITSENLEIPIEFELSSEEAILKTINEL